MLQNFILDEIKLSDAITPTAGAAGTTDINGTTLDMAEDGGWDGVLMYVRFGAITATAVTSVKAQQDTASNMATAADLAGSGQAVADSDDERVVVIDLHQPAERYVRVVVDRGTANAVVAEAHYLRYRGRKPGNFTQGQFNSAALLLEKHHQPAEGTA